MKCYSKTNFPYLLSFQNVVIHLTVLFGCIDSLLVHTKRLNVLRMRGGGEYVCGRQGSIRDILPR